jgi:hypothetical protein
MAGSQSRGSLTGLRPVEGFTTYPIAEENILSRSGGPADPRHGENQAGNPPYLTGPYPTAAGEQGAYGPSGLEDPFLDSWALGAGSSASDPDQSPHSHAGPFPSPGYGENRNTGGPPEQVEQQMANAAMHAADFGVAERVIEFNPQGTEYVNASFYRQYAESEGTTKTLGMRVPMTILSGEGGGRDIENLGNGGNPVFKVGHIGQRRVQDDGVPYNYQWIDALQRPFSVKRTGEKNTFDGQDSPYGAAGDETQNMMHSPDQAAVMTDATAYTPPADPSVAQAYTANDAWAW